MTWIQKQNSETKYLFKEFKFNDFIAALDFINQVGSLAESMDHHPIIWNCYNIVKLELHTHSENAITQKDYDLAKAIDSL